MQSDFALEHCSHLAKFYQLCMNETEGLVQFFSKAYSKVNYEEGNKTPSYT